MVVFRGFLSHSVCVPYNKYFFLPAAAAVAARGMIYEKKNGEVTTEKKDTTKFIWDEVRRMKKERTIKIFRVKG